MRSILVAGLVGLFYLNTFAKTTYEAYRVLHLRQLPHHMALKQRLHEPLQYALPSALFPSALHPTPLPERGSATFKAMTTWSPMDPSIYPASLKDCKNGGHVVFPRGTTRLIGTASQPDLSRSRHHMVHPVHE